MTIFYNDNLVNSLSGTKLTTFEVVKNYKGIEDSTSGIVNWCIDCISEDFNNYLDYNLYFANYEGTYTLNGCELLTNNIPIISISGVWFRLNSLDNWQVYDMNYLEKHNYSIFFKDDYFIPSSTSFRNIKINYNSGFQIIPSDIEKACVQEVCVMLDESTNKDVGGKGNLGKSSITIGSSNGNITTTFSKLSDKTIEVLNKYKKPF